MCVCVCVCVCMNICAYFLYPFNYWWTHLGYFNILAIENNCEMNISVHISYLISVFIFFEYPRVKLLHHMTVLFFNFLRNLYIVFDSGCTNLNPHHQCPRVLFSIHPHQLLLFLDYFIIAFLIGVR